MLANLSSFFSPFLIMLENPCVVCQKKESNKQCKFRRCATCCKQQALPCGVSKHFSGQSMLQAYPLIPLIDEAIEKVSYCSCWINDLRKL